MLNTTSPEVGEVRRARELGRCGHGRYIWHACEGCGVCRWVQYNHHLAGKHRRCRPCSRKVLAIKQRREGSSSWKGGRYINAQGYVVIHMPHDDPFRVMATKNGYVLEHRLVMAKHLGRALSSREVVHHKNSERQDNRLENLELMTNDEHHARHARGYKAGFESGYADGCTERIAELEKRITELEAELKACQCKL